VIGLGSQTELMPKGRSLAKTAIEPPSPSRSAARALVGMSCGLTATASSSSMTSSRRRASTVSAYHRRLVPAVWDPALSRARCSGVISSCITQWTKSVMWSRKPGGLVRVLGERWDRLDVVRIIASRQSESPSCSCADLPYAYSYLREGNAADHPRTASGCGGRPGQEQANKGLLVLSVDLLQRSYAVQVDCNPRRSRVVRTPRKT